LKFDVGKEKEKGKKKRKRIYRFLPSADIDGGVYLIFIM